MKSILLKFVDNVLSKNEMKELRGGNEDQDPGNNDTCGISCVGASSCRPSTDGCNRCNTDTGLCYKPL